MKSCKNFHQLIQKLFWNNISDIEKNLLDEHLDKCDHCKKIVDMHTALEKSPATTANKLPDDTYFKKSQDTGDKKEGKGVFSGDSDIGFISCVNVINIPFILEIKEMTIRSGGFGIIKNGLIRDRDIKDIF